jgi:hypothetical protein
VTDGDCVVVKEPVKDQVAESVGIGSVVIVDDAVGSAV